MFRLAAVAALASGFFGMVAAQAYADFPLNPAAITTLAGTVVGLGRFVGNVETNRALCSSMPTCIAFLCQTAANNCILLAAGTITNTAAPGFNSVHWRYDAPEGPSCNSATDTFTGFNGFCECNPQLEEQNTPFGCLARAVLPSQAAALKKKKMARNMIMPGVVKKTVFEERRVLHKPAQPYQPAS